MLFPLFDCGYQLGTRGALSQSPAGIPIAPIRLRISASVSCADNSFKAISSVIFIAIY